MGSEVTGDCARDASCTSGIVLRRENSADKNRTHSHQMLFFNGGRALDLDPPAVRMLVESEWQKSSDECVSQWWMSV